MKRFPSTPYSFTRPAVRPLCHHFIDSTHALIAASTPCRLVNLCGCHLRGTAPRLGDLTVPLIRPAMGNQRPGRAAHLVGQRYPPIGTTHARRTEPDWAEIHRQMKRPGATLQALHGEYLAENLNGLQRSQFCELYRRWCRAIKSYLRQTHAAGDKAFVDYAGPTIPVHDAATGRVLKAQIFVGVLGASNYTYAEAHWSPVRASLSRTEITFWSMT